MNEVHIIAPSVNSGTLVSRFPGFGSFGIGYGLLFGFQQTFQGILRIRRVQGISQMLEYFLVRKLRRSKVGQQLFQIPAACTEPMRMLIPLKLRDPFLDLLFFFLSLEQFLTRLLLSGQQLVHLGTHT